MFAATLMMRRDEAADAAALPPPITSFHYDATPFSPL